MEHSEELVLNTTYGSVMNITCKAGYKILGDPSVTCRSDSFWSPFPLCVPIGKCFSIAKKFTETSVMFYTALC